MLLLFDQTCACWIDFFKIANQQTLRGKSCGVAPEKGQFLLSTFQLVILISNGGVIPSSKLYFCFLQEPKFNRL